MNARVVCFNLIRKHYDSELFLKYKIEIMLDIILLISGLMVTFTSAAAKYRKFLDF